MNSQLVVFNGGLQTKVVPHLVEPNKAVECINVDIEKGSIYPFANWVERDITLTGNKAFYIDSDTTIANSDATEDRSYAVFGNRVYWSDGDYSAYGLMRWNGTTSVNAVAPTVSVYGTLTLTPTGTNGAMNETYGYCYTVVDTDGIESVPSPIYYTSPANQNVQISIGADTVSETVAIRRIYRTGGSNPTFNLIAELYSPTTSIIDATRDLDVSRIELATFDNYAPPATLKHLIENNGTFWGSVDNRIYFSREGQPEFWSPLDFIVLDATCTGIGKYRDLVIAFTESNTYVISGYNRDNVSLDKLPYNEGCLNHHTIANVTEMLVWTSKNGVCVFNGDSVEIITRNILSWNKDTIVGTATFDSFIGTFDANIGYKVEYAIGLRGKYYAVYQDGVGVLDLQNGIIASTITLDGVRTLYYDKEENLLCGITDDLTVYAFDKDSANMMAEWKTVKLGGESYSTKKQFRRITLDNSPSFVHSYVDDKLVFSIYNTKDFFLPSGSIGHTLQLHIGTDVEVRSLKYEFGVLDARQTS